MIYIVVLAFWAFVIIGGIYGNRDKVGEWLGDSKAQLDTVKAIGWLIGFFLMILGACTILF